MAFITYAYNLVIVIIALIFPSIIPSQDPVLDMFSGRIANRMIDCILYNIFM